MVGARLVLLLTVLDAAIVSPAAALVIMKSRRLIFLLMKSPRGPDPDGRMSFRKNERGQFNHDTPAICKDSPEWCLGETSHRHSSGEGSVSQFPSQMKLPSDAALPLS